MHDGPTVPCASQHRTPSRAAPSLTLVCCIHCSPQALYPWRRVLREMFHHDRQLGQVYCLRGTDPVVVSTLVPAQGSRSLRCCSRQRSLLWLCWRCLCRAVPAGTFKPVCSPDTCPLPTFPYSPQVATELALRLQSGVPDFAQWRHLLADALELPLAGALRRAVRHAQMRDKLLSVAPGSLIQPGT